MLRSLTGFASLSLLALTAATAPGTMCAALRQADSAATAPRIEAAAARPAELYPIERVVDGDTLRIRRNGEIEKLRLLSVDTEEKLAFEDGGATKPGTVFGEETSHWAQDFFAHQAEGDEPARIGLLFPGGVEARDVYGRLLCHVLLEDGTDFNLLLVREGKSPYFNKYGNSEIAHAAFVEAQAQARAEKLGIWNPDTNVAVSPETPSARRPYEQLVPWWDLRAAAVDRFRARAAAEPLAYVAADDPAGLARAFAAKLEVVHVFALVDRVFAEDDGSLTVLLRSGDKNAAVRFLVSADLREAFREIDFEGFNATFDQNYAWFRGRLERGPRNGYALRGVSPDQVERAEPRTPTREEEPSGAGRAEPAGSGRARADHNGPGHE